MRVRTERDARRVEQRKASKLEKAHATILYVMIKSLMDLGSIANKLNP
jgi:hypothetical protein